jgi:hypothetical protein
MQDHGHHLAVMPFDHEPWQPYPLSAVSAETIQYVENKL